MVAQSTQNTEKVLKIVKILKAHIEKVLFFNTICQPTRKKQQEIKSMPKHNDLMIIIGSKSSANTKRLYEISKSLNPRSYWVNSWRSIQKAWLRDAKTIGITAGASTPDDITQIIVGRIKELIHGFESR